MLDANNLMIGVTYDRMAERIPWSAIDRYAERIGLIGDDYDVFLELVRAMDEAFVSTFNGADDEK